MLGGLALVLLVALASTQIATTGGPATRAAVPVETLLDGAAVVTAQTAQTAQTERAAAAGDVARAAPVVLDPALPEAEFEGVAFEGAAGGAPLPAALATSATSAEVATVVGRWTVAPGDSLLSIAAAFETTVEAIVRQNGLADEHTIYSGQRLEIPLVLRPVPGLGATDGSGGPALVPWTVGPGDSLSALARDFDTTTTAIAAVNALPGDALIIGQLLGIPEGWR